MIVIALVSIFAISPVVSKNEFHKGTIEVLNSKEMRVTGITAAAVAASTGLAAIPGDATTPIANEILQLSSKLAVIIGAIFLEKILLTLTGYLTFTILIPISCALFMIYLFIKNDIFKRLAIKLAAFGLIIFIIVPLSVKVSSIIENNNDFKVKIDTTVQEANNIQTEESNDNSSEESSGWSAITSKVKEGVSNIGNTANKALEKGKELLTNFIDAIAVLIITSCVIPIVVLLSFVWIVKIIFNITIPTPTYNFLNNGKKNKKKDKENNKEAENDISE